MFEGKEDHLERFKKTLPGEFISEKQLSAHTPRQLHLHRHRLRQPQHLLGSLINHVENATHRIYGTQIIQSDPGVALLQQEVQDEFSPQLVLHKRQFPAIVNEGWPIHAVFLRNTVPFRMNHSHYIALVQLPRRQRWAS